LAAQAEVLTAIDVDAAVMGYCCRGSARAATSFDLTLRRVVGGLARFAKAARRSKRGRVGLQRRDHAALRVPEDRRRTTPSASTPALSHFPTRRTINPVAHPFAQQLSTDATIQSVEETLDIHVQDPAYVDAPPREDPRSVAR